MRAGEAWALTKDSVNAFVEDGALSRGAAIAFYAVTSLGPVLLIIVAVAGLVYGREAATGALMDRLSGLMGSQSAAFLQTAIQGAGHYGAGVIATIVGVVSLVLTASGVFGETQTALNAIWRAKSTRSTAWEMARSRLLSLLLVAGMGIVLVVSLVLSAAVAGLKDFLDQIMPFAATLIEVANLVLSLAILSGMIAAIYKVLPDRHLEWRDVIAGATVTAFLITVGKIALGVYIGNSATISSFGAAGSVLAALLWIYYSAQIFLLGAEFTRIYADRDERLRRSPAGSAPPSDQESAAPGRLSQRAG
jgi:membrane protein